MTCVQVVQVMAGNTSDFPVTVGFDQCSPLTPYLFALLMDELTRRIQNEVCQCMLFADDVVLLNMTKVGN